MKNNLFGERLKELRTEKTLSQMDIAKIFKVKDSTVSRWEQGKIEPDYDRLVEISNYFKVSTDYLLGKE